MLCVSPRNYFGDPPLDWHQHVNTLLVVCDQKLNLIIHMRSHRCQTEGNNHSLDLLGTLLLVQPFIGLAFIAAVLNYFISLNDFFSKWTDR